MSHRRSLKGSIVPDKNEFCGMKIEISKTDFYQGEFISGEIEVEVLQSFGSQMKILTIGIKGYEKSKFDKPSGSMYTKQPIEGSTPIKISTVPPRPGLYKFPFLLQVDSNLEPSFKYKTEGSSQYGIVEYFLNGALSGANKGNLEVEKTIIIKSIMKNPNKALENTINYSLEKRCCGSSGIASITYMIEKESYKINDKIYIGISIDNQMALADLTYIQIFLIQEIILENSKEKAKDKYKRKIDMDKITYRVASGSVGPEVYSQLQLSINNIKYNDPTWFSQPTYQSSLLKCNYKINLQIGYNGCCTKIPNLDIPIIVFNNEAIIDTSTPVNLPEHSDHSGIKTPQAQPTTPLKDIETKWYQPSKGNDKKVLTPKMVAPGQMVADSLEEEHFTGNHMTTVGKEVYIYIYIY